MSFPVTFSIVTYNSEAVIAQCLDSIPAGAHIIVADNASTDATRQIIREHYPQVTLIENPRNLGFGAAHNLILKQVETPFAFLLNPDAQLRQNCLEQLLETAEHYPQAILFAPALLDEQGKTRTNSYNRCVFQRSKNRRLPLPSGPACAEFLSGAALLVRCDKFRELGGFDENLFLFYEDDDLCLKAVKAGEGGIFVPQAKVFHLIGKSSPTRSWHDIRHKYGHMARSELYFHAKYRGRTAMHKKRVKQVLHSTGKTLAYALTGQGFKCRKYTARLLGTLGLICH